MADVARSKQQQKVKLVTAEVESTWLVAAV
jgi:hypothetical protein